MTRRHFGWAVVLTVLAACGAGVPPVAAPGPALAGNLGDLPPGAVAAKASSFGTDVIGLPTGAVMTPDATPGSRLFDLDPRLPEAPGLRAGNAVATALSPDGSTLLVLTSGFNRTYDTRGKLLPAASGEYVFVYDVFLDTPRQIQVVGVPNSFGGLAFHPSGNRFYVSGGPDDVVHELVRDGATRTFAPAGKPIGLGHLSNDGLGGLGIGQGPYAAGIALSRSGARLVVANHENDSLSVIDTASRAVVAEVRLAPGGGRPGGEFPSGVVIVGESRAFVTCQRDREVVEVDLERAAVAWRIKVGGQPTKLVANRTGTRVFVANANSDSVSVLDTASGRVVADIPTAPPVAATLRGSNPNALALSSDEKTLYVTNGGNDTLAVIALEGDQGRVAGLVPTGFYPNAVSVSSRGNRFFVAHGKSPTGPNPGGPWSDRDRGFKSVDPGTSNQYAPQLTRGGLLVAPVPDRETLKKLTAQSIENNRFASSPSAVPAVFRELAGNVKHVIYVIGENRTYDQVFADVRGADGDPKLLMWGEAITPNLHRLARTYTTFDRFFDAGGVSGDGWQWTVSGRSTDVAEKVIPIEYANRGHHTYDWEGANRGVNVGLSTVAERVAWNPRTPPDPDLLPGNADVGAIDGPNEGGVGFLWDAALTAGLSVRNYGVFCEDFRYGLPKTEPAFLPPIPMPFDTKTRVAFPTRGALTAVTDPYFRGFDMSFADVRRLAEWERELDEYVKKGELPALELVRLPHDHFGSFDTAQDGVETPDQQIADHDYAVGRLVERLSRTPFWESTVVVVLEDDAQNGADHVDAHRSFVLFAGGHVKRGGAVVSTTYATPSVLKTIELLLGMGPLGQQDAFARPIVEAFDVHADITPFMATVPAVLRSTRLPLPPPAAGERAQAPRGDASTWALLTRGMDFRHEDDLPTEAFNRALACGLGVAPAGCTSRAVDVQAEEED
jgi:YVTN family beta-propeller protein